MAQNQIDHPAHYNQNGIECFDVIKAAIGVDGFKNFCEGNLIKYVYRMRLKGQYLNDLKKARFYADTLIKLQEDTGATL